MSFDTLTLECFLAVAETGSFTAASKQICRTQSAVSQQIAKLERLLGAKLLQRGAKFALTPKGEVFLTYAKQIYKLHREALDRFNEPGLEGEVRFGIPEDFASLFLTDVLREFSQLHPRILLHVECDLTLNLFDRFNKNEFDLVLVKMINKKDFPRGIDVWSENLVWVGNSDTYDVKKIPQLPLVLSPQPCVFRSRALDILEQRKKQWHIVFSSYSYAARMASVSAGMGITILPRNMVPDSLHIIKSSGLPALGKVHIALLQNTENSAVIKSLENFVLEKLKL